MSKVHDKGEAIVNTVFDKAEKKFKKENYLSPYEYIMNYGYDNLGEDDIKAVAAYYGYPHPNRLNDPEYFFCHAPFGDVYPEILKSVDWQELIDNKFETRYFPLKKANF